MAKGDFHLHSTASDGVQTPAWVMETAAANGVRILSLTDHDTTAGDAEARAAADRLGLRLIPGIELSTDYGKADVHLLGYGIDIDSKPLQDFLEEQREGRRARGQKIVDILRGHGMPVELDRVLDIAGEATLGRPHVARALVEKGYVASVQQAFDLWLGNGKPADVDRKKLSPEEAIAMIHENGGVVSSHTPFTSARTGRRWWRSSLAGASTDRDLLQTLRPGDGAATQGRGAAAGAALLRRQRLPRLGTRRPGDRRHPLPRRGRGRIRGLSRRPGCDGTGANV
jgi:predicted metal-dependent phosphoesterase TrpH